MRPGDHMPAEISIDLAVDVKLKTIDIIKLRLAGVKGKELMDFLREKMQPATCDLVNELAKREGVEEFWIAPHEERYTIAKSIPNTNPVEVTALASGEGAARILVVID